MSTTVEIPGGTAELYDKDELTARRKRPSRVLLTAHADLIEKVSTAATVIAPDGRVEINKNLADVVLYLSEDDALNLDRIQDATTWGLLKAWDLDLPLPATPDDLLDIPDGVYEALKLAVSKHTGIAAELAELFEPSDISLEDTSSPSGASEESRPSSQAKKQPSDRKPPKTSKSTGVAKRSAGPTTNS